MRLPTFLVLWLALLWASWTPCGAGLGRAQAQAPVRIERQAPTQDIEKNVEVAPEATDAPESFSHNIGGMPDEPRLYIYSSPLKKLGFDIGFGVYAVNALTSIVYMLQVYPIQKLFGDTTFEPVMPWLLLPIAGPVIAQFTDHVRDLPVWRAVLIGDAALQATGLVIGLLGLALSGERTRDPDDARATDVHYVHDRTMSVEVQLGVAGMSMSGLTLTLHTF